MTKRFVPKSTMSRLPLYLSYLKRLPLHISTISASAIADGLSFNHVQVRKDLACISNGGRPKIGYRTKDLMNDLQMFFSARLYDHAVIVGMGPMGQALAQYSDFAAFGFKIVAAFDYDERNVGKRCGDIEIWPVGRLYDFCNAGGIRLGVITTEATVAQEACDMLTGSGSIAIWNFSPISLKAPDEVLVYNEGLTESIAALAAHIKHST